MLEQIEINNSGCGSKPASPYINLRQISSMIQLPTRNQNIVSLPNIQYNVDDNEFDRILKLANKVTKKKKLIQG